MKINKKIMSASLLTVLCICATACGDTKATDEVIADNEIVVEVDSKEETTNSLLYGTVNLSYADFYYGEINNIEPDYTTTAGQYELMSKVTAAGFDKEGMYDAVTSATNQKSTRFAASFFEETQDGVNILGVANVNVAINSLLYQDVQNAISNGTVCNNELVAIVSNMVLSETEPAEYKVINADGTVSKTIGQTTIASDIKASFTTISSWGNYQFSFEGLALEADQMMGAIIETDDGLKYGLEHEDNLWLSPSEVSFCAVPFTEPHGNEVAYQRFSDIQGKTIVKFTYLVSNDDDIEIPVNAFVNYILDTSYGLSADTQVEYSTDGTVINYSLNIPDDSNYSLTSIKCGRSSIDMSNVKIDSSSVTLPCEFTPGSYTLIFEDSKYSGLKASTLVDSGLKEEDISFDGESFVINKDCGLSGTDFVKNFASLTVNGEEVRGRGLSNILFDESGKLLIDAALESNDGTSTPIFPEGENEVTIAASGFPTVTFTITK